jgi:glucosyl-3-phosphoglycerate synthase
MADWFHERTYRAEDFDLDDLARRKAELGVSVSVVLPARNEAETIGGMVQACGSLAGSLVDELVVVDGDSTDDTATIAVDAGARVHTDSQIMPEVGRPQGKGDALWRSLAVTSGDIVVFVDSDIRNPDPRFVWGLLAPLLTTPEIAFVKAYYDRPLAMGREQHATGGGRVTELMARPLLNLYWPPLANLIQPLSGEYAGRRTLLESLPFFTGYGVELGLLIDTLAHVGIDAIAQVDLAQRYHRNQSMHALSRMAYGILQVAAIRLAQEGRGAPPPAAGRYLQFDRVDGDVRPESSLVQLTERPSHRSMAGTE